MELFKARAGEFDAVATDMTMPQMTGERLAKAIMKVRPDTPIVLCTGFSEQIDKDKAKEIGIEAFIMKPITMRDMAGAIRRMLDD